MRGKTGQSLPVNLKPAFSLNYKQGLKYVWEDFKNNIIELYYLIIIINFNLSYYKLKQKDLEIRVMVNCYV